MRHGIQQCAHSTNHQRVQHNIRKHNPKATDCGLRPSSRHGEICDDTATCPSEARGRKEEKEKIESDCTHALIILEILRRDSAIYLRRTFERVRQNTIGESGQREELKSGGGGGEGRE